jgi:hypothetical protein
LIVGLAVASGSISEATVRDVQMGTVFVGHHRAEDDHDVFNDDDNGRTLVSLGSAPGWCGTNQTAPGEHLRMPRKKGRTARPLCVRRR